MEGQTAGGYILEKAFGQLVNAIRLDVFTDNKVAVRLYRYFEFEFVGKVFFDKKELGHEWYDCYEKMIL